MAYGAKPIVKTSCWENYVYGHMDTYAHSLISLKYVHFWTFSLFMTQHGWVMLLAAMVIE
jgi:hypothetical protein